VPGTGTTTFKYDPFGRRIQKSGPLGTTNYLYDGQDISSNVIEELDSVGNVLARYTQGPGIDRPLAEFNSGAASYYEADALGSVTSLSNSAGAAVNTYSYDSFGNLITSAGVITNHFQYTGREVDPETGLNFTARGTIAIALADSLAKTQLDSKVEMISMRTCETTPSCGLTLLVL